MKRFIVILGEDAQVFQTDDSELCTKWLKEDEFAVIVDTEVGILTTGTGSDSNQAGVLRELPDIPEPAHPDDL